MRVLFDHSTPSPLSNFLGGHVVVEARNRGRDTLANGDLLDEAEKAGFDVLLTADKNMRYQQNLTGRRIALVVLSTLQWPVVRLRMTQIVSAINAVTPGSHIEVDLLEG